MTNKTDRSIIATALQNKIGDVPLELNVSTAITLESIATKGKMDDIDYYQVFGALTLQKLRSEFARTLYLSKSNSTQAEKTEQIEGVGTTAYLLTVLTDRLLATNSYKQSSLDEFDYKYIVDVFIQDIIKEYDIVEQDIKIGMATALDTDDIEFDEIRDLLDLAKEIKKAKKNIQ